MWGTVVLVPVLVLVHVASDRSAGAGCTASWTRRHQREVELYLSVLAHLDVLAVDIRNRTAATHMTNRGLTLRASYPDD